MPTLAELQASLAQRLTGDPAAETDPTLSRAARALQHKRMRAVAQLLPRTRKVAGPEWSQLFSQHAAGYTPSGLLYHVDDAWEFGLAQARSSNRAIRRAARLDLAWLNLRFARSPNRGAQRVRERTGFYFSVTVDPIVVSLRVPGRRPRVFASSR
ncbi:MAG: hypothetical protein WEE89_08550 [Gemmatimonadota bacterium]